jgi:hypothetical protein
MGSVHEHKRRTPEYFADYWRERNAAGIDGLPAMPAAPAQS